jgi:lipid-A-disaccharide synthase
MSLPPKHIVIIAGEESGDKHAANLAKELYAWNNSLTISGIGGKHLQQAGVKLISDLAKYGVTGMVEVFKQAWVIKKAYTAIKVHLQKSKPDLLILVDYPGFNLRLAKFAKKMLGLRIIYYISPQIWAWKANRIHTIKAHVDRMAVILPFEKKIYEKATVPVSFVGHPLVHSIPNYTDISSLKTELSLPPNKKIVALLPGSRRNEIAKHMPVLVETMKKLLALEHNIHFIIPIASTLDVNSIKKYVNNITQITFTEGKAQQVVACSDCVVVASGTASLECALLNKPMCIIYKTSLITYIAARKVMMVKYLGLCNLLENKMIVPELLQQDCNPKELTAMVRTLLEDKKATTKMIDNLRKLKLSLSKEQADLSISQVVKDELSQ